MSDKLNVEKVHKEIRGRLKHYLEEAIRIYGDNLRSALLFGSALEEKFRLKHSNINLVFVFRSIDAQTMKAGLSLVKKGIKKKIIAPLFFTEKHIETSKDSFPMELLEIKERHLAVYGSDPFEGLNVPSDHLRLECEQQIKGMLIRLRQSFLEIGSKRKGIERLLHASFSSTLPIFRTILRLRKETVPSEKEDLIIRVAGECDLNADVFLALLRDKEGDEKIGGHEAIDFFDRYLKELTNLAHKVDEMTV